MSRTITVSRAAWLGVSLARACGKVGPISVYKAAAAGLEVHRRFHEQGREIRVQGVN